MRLTFLLFASVLVLPLPVGAADQTAQARKSAPPSTANKPAPPAVTRTIDIVGNDDMKFSVTRIVAKRGEVLRIRLVSKGTIPKIVMAHNVVILKPTANVDKFIAAGAPFRTSDFIDPATKDQVLAATPFAGPGETVELSFRVPMRAATYPYVCTFAGHSQSGMKGVIVVR